MSSLEADVFADGIMESLATDCDGDPDKIVELWSEIKVLVDEYVKAIGPWLADREDTIDMTDTEDLEEDDEDVDWEERA